MPREEPEVFRITSAHASRSEGVRLRARTYFLQMGIRTACIPLVVIVPGWPKWIFIVGAVVLPYIAVVLANAGHENDPVEDLEPFTIEPLAALPPGPRTVHDDL